MLLPRIGTILVGLPILLGVVYMGGLPFFLVMIGIILVGLREFYYLARETGYPSFPMAGFIAGGLVALSVYGNGIAFGSVTENQATSALFACILAFVIIRSVFKGPADTTLSEWAITFFGVFYVAWSLSHLLLLRDLRPQGLPATMMLFAIVWAEDICAYIVGTRWGTHLIAQKVSPRKTWEGTIAGVLAAMLVAALFQMTVLKTFLRPVEAPLLAGAIAILAFASDLGESILKRGAGAKDSSPLLPGHGGILDRFDSFVLAAPFYYYYWAFVKH